MRAFLVCLILYTTATAQQQTKHDGNWWNDSGEGFRVGFVTGYLMSMNTVGDVAITRCMLDRGYNLQMEPKALQELMNSCSQTPEAKPYQAYSGFTVGQWKDGIDEFYKDFRNRSLGVQLAIRWVNEQLHGTAAKELEDMVTEWRRKPPQ
jgi:hypothetical protein